MILTLPDHAERRRIIKKMHKTKDKDHYRRLNAILLLADGQTVTKVPLLSDTLVEIKRVIIISMPSYMGAIVVDSFDKE